MFTPGNFPARASSKLVTGTSFTNFDALTLEIAPVTFAFDCVP